jgi:hypothetical protein
LLLAAVAASAEPKRLNGFVLEPGSIPVQEILRGGPARDAIPALDDPMLAEPGSDEWSGDERVIGVVVNGEARAYPIALLVWHELVNDVVGGVPILVSYCPLCGTAMVYDRRLDGRVRRFGVSGLLYNSDLLMFDRETESLWSQVIARAVTGPAAGERLELLRSRMLSWKAWKRENPDSRVLSRRTGHRRRYGASPYGNYAQSKSLYFPVDRDERYHPKLPTLGLRSATGAARAYPASEVERAGGRVSEMFQGARVTIHYDSSSQTFRASADASVDIIEGYWFAWAAFHPETEVFRAPPPQQD